MTSLIVPDGLTGSKRKRAKMAAVRRPVTLPGGALAAAELYTARLGTRRPLSMAAAGDLHDVTRQAVSRALRDPGRYAREVPAGRKPRGADMRRITVHFSSGRLVSVRITAAEHDAFRRCAGDAGVSGWLRELTSDDPKSGSQRIRALGRNAAILAGLLGGGARVTNYA